MADAAVLRAVYDVLAQRRPRARPYARRSAGERSYDVLACADLALRGGPASAARASVGCNEGGKDPCEKVEEFLAAETAKRAEHGRREVAAHRLAAGAVLVDLLLVVALRKRCERVGHCGSDVVNVGVGRMGLDTVTSIAKGFALRNQVADKPALLGEDGSYGGGEVVVPANEVATSGARDVWWQPGSG